MRLQNRRQMPDVISIKIKFRSKIMEKWLVIKL
jgi:hypothetical protein